MEDVASKTGEVPAALINRPKRWIWFEEYLQAFHLLSPCRSIGFSRNPISFQDIVAYAQFYEVEDFDTFCKLIQKIDDTYLTYLQKLEKIKSNEPTDVNTKGRS